MKIEKIIKGLIKGLCAYFALAAGIAVGSAVIRFASNPFVLIGAAGCACGLYLGRKHKATPGIDTGKTDAVPEGKEAIAND